MIVVTNDTKPSLSDYQVVNNKRLALFMRLVFPHLFFGILSASLIYFLFEPFSHSAGRKYWLQANVILIIISTLFYLIYWRFNSHIALTCWGRITFIVALLWGGVWSLPPLLFTSNAPILYDCVMIIFTVSLVSLPAPAMSYYPFAYFAFMTPPLISIFFKVMSYAQEGAVILVIMTPFLWLTLLLYGWDLHKILVNSIRLQIENLNAFKEAQLASEAKSKFIATASHDIRQPLQASLFLLEALKSRESLEHNLCEYIESLDNSLESMSALLNGLLDISKLDAGTTTSMPENISIGRFLSSIEREYKYKVSKDTPVKVEFNYGTEVVLVDKVMLRQVIDNLFSNSLRYTEKGLITISTVKKDSRLDLVVEDTGIGIDDKYQDLIFEEFYQVNNSERDLCSGIGLGLSIVKKICVSQGWLLSMKSKLGKGTRFKVSIPLGHDQKMASNIDDIPDHGFNVLRGKSIAILESNYEIRKNLKKLILNWGCRVTDAGNINDMINSLNNESIDLLIIDFRLKDKLNGIEAKEKLENRLGKKFSALMLTGDTTVKDLVAIKESGVRVLHKPVKPALLRTMVTKIIINN